jgi:predicted RNA-binding Zn-ribbon protein involved in translation (DUF1610 family)
MTIACDNCGKHYEADKNTCVGENEKYLIFKCPDCGISNFFSKERLDKLLKEAGIE